MPNETPEAPDAPETEATPASPDGSAPLGEATTPEASSASVDDTTKEPELGDLSGDELLAALDKMNENERNGKNDPKEEEEPEQQPAEEHAAPAPEPAKEPESDDDAPEKPLPKNFRIHTEDPKLSRFLKTLKQNPDANPAEVARLVGYEIPGGGQPSQKGQPAPNEPAPDPLQGLRDEIAGYDPKIKEAFEVEYDNQKALALAQEKFRKELQLERKQEQMEAESVAAQEYHQDYQKVTAEVLKSHPDLANGKSLQSRVVAAIREDMEREEPAVFENPNYPKVILERAKEQYPELFKSAATSAAAKPAAPAAAKTVQPAARTRPVGQVLPGNVPTPPAVDPKIAIREMTPDQIRAAMDKGNDILRREAGRR